MKRLYDTLVVRKPLVSWPDHRPEFNLIQRRPAAMLQAGLQVKKDYRPSIKLELSTSKHPPHLCIIQCILGWDQQAVIIGMGDVLFLRGKGQYYGCIHGPPRSFPRFTSESWMSA